MFTTWQGGCWFLFGGSRANLISEKTGLNFLKETRQKKTVLSENKVKIKKKISKTYFFGGGLKRIPYLFE